MDAPCLARSRSRPHNFIWHCTGEGDLKSHSATTHPGTSQPLCKYGQLQVLQAESLVYYVLWTHLCNDTWKFERSGRTKSPRVWRAEWVAIAPKRQAFDTLSDVAGDERVIMHHSRHQATTKPTRWPAASSDQPSRINHLGSRAKKIIDCAGLSPLKCIAWWPASHIPDLACRSPSFITQSRPVNLLRRHPFTQKQCSVNSLSWSLPHLCPTALPRS